jgi:hypothetical protein
MEGTRLFRSIWVGLVNGCGIIMLAETIASERKMYNLLETKTPLHTYFLPVLGIVILFAGILLELKQSRAAGYWNTGVYLVVALYSLGLIVISSAGETEARNYGILFGVPSFIIAVATSLLYWRASLRRKHPPQPTAS